MASAVALRRLEAVVGKAVEGNRTPRRFRCSRVPNHSARSWTAPVLWRFDSVRRTDNVRNLVLTFATFGGKAVEGYRTTRRFARIEGFGGSSALG